MSEPLKIPGVQAQWQEFLKGCDPRGKFNPMQRREMRRAFLAGFYSMIATLALISEQETTDENDMRCAEAIQGLGDECERLIREMIKTDFQTN